MARHIDIEVTLLCDYCMLNLERLWKRTDFLPSLYEDRAMSDEYDNELY
jgi:hypothetical protein